MAAWSRNCGNSESPVDFALEPLPPAPIDCSSRPSPRSIATTLSVAGASSLNGSGFNDTGLGLVEPGGNSPRCARLLPTRNRPPTLLRTAMPVGQAHRAIAREGLPPSPHVASHHATMPAGTAWSPRPYHCGRNSRNLPSDAQGLSAPPSWDGGAARSPRPHHRGRDRRNLPGDALGLSAPSSWDGAGVHSPQRVRVASSVADSVERPTETGGSRHGRGHRSSVVGRRRSPRPAVATESVMRNGLSGADAPESGTATLLNVMDPNTAAASRVAASPEASWTPSLASTTASTRYSRGCSQEDMEVLAVLASDDVNTGFRLPSSEGQHGHPSRSNLHVPQSFVHPTSVTSAAVVEIPPRLPCRGNSTLDSGAGAVEPRRSDSVRRTLRATFAAEGTIELDSVAASVGGGSSCSGHTPADASGTPAGSKVVKPLKQGQKIYDLYSWHEVLQEEGNGGKVVVCRPKQPDLRADMEYVMKIRSRAELRKLRLEEQFHRVQERLLCFPSHPGIVRLHEVLLDDAFYYVVMEKAGSEKLFCSLVADHGDGCMPAPSVRRLVGGILDAVRHVHQQGMLHRDIKPDNIVMRPANSSRARAGVTRKRPVLIDFDHADPEWSPKRQQAGDVFGTLRFNAPEALLGNFLPQSDLYSVGAILYLLMTGRFPYAEDVYSAGTNGDAWTHDRRKAVHMAMKEACIDFRGPPWPDQPRCHDFCSRLLAFNASERPISAEHALCHDWFQEQQVDMIDE